MILPMEALFASCVRAKLELPGLFSLLPMRYDKGLDEHAQFSCSGNSERGENVKRTTTIQFVMQRRIPAHVDNG